MGGRIGAQPRETGGSVFWFSAELPETDRALAGHAWEADANPSAKNVAVGRGLMVLLAEDDEINRMVAQALLTKLGMQTAVAHNGREAIEMAASHSYDAILMDCMMPVVDGLQATHQIRAAEGTSHVPIIAMTALAMPGDRERCLTAGMDDYLSKPIRLAALQAAIHRVTARSGPLGSAAL